MDAAIAEVLAAGRTLVVPSRHRAAALQQAWARRQAAAGEGVWRTPEILTFDAWFAREWQRARDAGSLVHPRQLLNTAQERRLWAQVLGAMEADGSPSGELRIHAPALMHAAARARRSLVDPGRAGSAEERLLAAALEQVDRLCERSGWLIPGLARPVDLQGLSPRLPVLAGFAQVPPLAAHIAGWEGGAGQLALPQRRCTPHLHAAADARAEVRAAAQWCRALLAADPGCRLLVLDRGGELPLAQVGALLWDRLAEGTRAGPGEAPDPRLLGVEGGPALLEQGLFDDVLAALSLPREPIAFETVSQLLRSAHFGFLPPGPASKLELALRRIPRQRYDIAMLRAALARIEPQAPGAVHFGEVLQQFTTKLRPRESLGAAAWAKQFTDALRDLGFPGSGAMDSHQAQRLARWNELLDEFATLDAIAPALSADEAVAQLVQLARHGRHEAASLDASITLAGEGGDPLADYDGIWVMGLSATRWPEPPRPDPFISLAAQRRAGWAESSVALRLRHATFELDAWQARAAALVLSYGRHAGDVHQLPSVPVAGFKALPAPVVAPRSAAPVLRAATDASLPPLAGPGEAIALPRGVRCVELQHSCPFRAQGELRLRAVPLESPPEGIDARLRGDLLHAALQELWSDLGDSDALRALDEDARIGLCEMAWDRAQRAVLSRLPLPPAPRPLARERRRGIALLSQLLAVETGRDPFSVQGRELPREVDLGGPSLRLRIDRIDAFPDGSRRVIDYKTGSGSRVNLDVDPPEPLQLAVYAAALKAAGDAPQAVALLQVSARQLAFSGGGSAGSDAARDLAQVADWEERLSHWQAIVRAVAAAHVRGEALVAPLGDACRHCHLPRFCRIGDAALPLADAVDEGPDAPEAGDD